MQAGIIRLRKRIEEVEQFDPQTVTEQYNIPEIDRLKAAVDDSLVRTFGADTVEYNRYKDAAYFDNGPHNYAYRVPIEHVQRSLGRSKARNLALLEQAVQSLKEQLSERQPTVASGTGVRPERSRKVFVVHGHDNTPKAEVARYIEKIGLEAIILHERPNKGRTLITKFREEAADVGFAVVLMTPDDHGGAAGESTKPRARQNVVFELGFFIGALGPARVAALVKGNVEPPSDFDGVVYISLDHADWATELARELQEAGFEIDWNRVMRR
jgi:predicted nucleotide-binding protein